MSEAKVKQIVKNQFIIYDNDGNEWFQSYETTIAQRDSEGNLYLDMFYWDYSRTTGKYRNIFTGLNKKETEKAIENGKITLTNLNNQKRGGVCRQYKS